MAYKPCCKVASCRHSPQTMNVPATRSHAKIINHCEDRLTQCAQRIKSDGPCGAQNAVVPRWAVPACRGLEFRVEHRTSISWGLFDAQAAPAQARQCRSKPEAQTATNPAGSARSGRT